MSDELLPCPFCGATAHVRRRSHSMPRPQRYQVQCGECYCGTSDRFETAEYAAASWNKRKTPQRVADMTRALEKIAEGCEQTAALGDGDEPAISHAEARTWAAVAKQARAALASSDSK